MIRFQCPACQKVLKLVDGGAGQKVSCPSCSRTTRMFLLRLAACGIGAVFAFALLAVTLAKIAHRGRSRSPVSSIKNAPSQIQLDEATLLQRLATVPELRFVSDAAIRDAKKRLGDSTGFVESRFGGETGQGFVEELNKDACDRAEKAGLSIEWKFMRNTDRDDMAALSLELRKNQMVGVDRSSDSFFTPSEADVANKLNGYLNERGRPGFLPTVVQMLQVEPEPSRAVMINKLDLLGYSRPQQRPNIVEAIAARALYDNSMEVRAAALRALETSDKSLYVTVLLKGLDYPWTPVVWRASYALRKFGTLQVVPELAKMLEKKPREESADTVTELVRISHLHSCLFCHRPAFDKSGAKVPIPGESLTPKEPSRSSTAPAFYAPVKPRELAVDPGATCLHQDFSVVLPVANCGSWPDKQRFDFTTRIRPATKADGRRLEEISRERRKAAYYALEGIVAREGKELARPNDP